MIDKKTYNTLSWTWGLPMTIIGKLAELILTALGHKSEKFGYAKYFVIGEGWGGVSLGKIFIVSKDCGEDIKKHEYGHTVQNCIFGFLMPFIVCIPSAIRCLWFKCYYRKGLTPPTDYDSIWFEKQATMMGNLYKGDE